jgi:hypothetical protein
MPRLKTLLLQALRAWFLAPPNGDLFQILPSADDTLEVRCLVFQQNSIGWEQLFLGRFSNSWGSLQDAYYARRAHSIESKRQTGQRWQNALIDSIWQQWFLLWELRNKALHGEGTRAQALAERRIVERTLIDIYDLRNQMEPSVQHILCRDITEHFAKPVSYNRNWLAVHGPLFKLSIKRAKEKAIQGVKSIRHYFANK